MFENTRRFLAAGVAAAVLAAPVGVALGGDAPEGFRPLFNGKDLAGWEGKSEFWSVEDGAIVGRTTKAKPTRGNTFLIWTGGTVRDFELRIKWKLLAHNSGVQYRSRHLGKHVVAGYQADMDYGNRYTGILYEEKGRGILAGRGTRVTITSEGKKRVTGKTAGAKSIAAAVKKDGWNEYVIVARGNRLVQRLNGLTTVEVTDEQASKRAMEGILALQLHAGPPMTVQFKDIYLKDLSDMTDKPETSAGGGEKTVLLIAGRDSHGFDSHAHVGGCRFLAECINKHAAGVSATVSEGWPKDAKVFEDVDAVVVFSDGGGRQPFVRRLEEVGKLADAGVGIGCIHYAVEVPKGKAGERMLDWIGGYFEAHWSVNPHWTAEFKSVPSHAITRGVGGFSLRDEWYYHMRFRPEMKGVTPLLSALPPANTLKRPDGAHSNNPHVREAVLERKEPQHLAWASVRELPGGGVQRGFGTTAGHFHWNFAQDDLRTLVLNAIVWLAGADVPEGGVKTPTPTAKEMLEYLPGEAPENFDVAGKQKAIEAMNAGE